MLSIECKRKKKKKMLEKKNKVGEINTGWSGHEQLPGWVTGRVRRPRSDKKKQMPLERFLVSGSECVCVSGSGGLGDRKAIT